MATKILGARALAPRTTLQGGSLAGMCPGSRARAPRPSRALPDLLLALPHFPHLPDLPHLADTMTAASTHVSHSAPLAYEKVALPCSTMNCGDVIYRSTLDRQLRQELRTVDPLLFLGIATALLYLTATPGVLQGAWDTYVAGPSQRRRQVKLAYQRHITMRYTSYYTVHTVYTVDRIPNHPLPPMTDIYLYPDPAHDRRLPNVPPPSTSHYFFFFMYSFLS